MRLGYIELALACVVCSLPATAPATTLTYECEIRERGNSGWIPSELTIVHDTEQDTALIWDPVVLLFNEGQPLEGRVDIENARRITFAWSVKEARSDTGQYVSAMNYRATLLKEREAIRIFAIPLGYSNNFNGDGTCSLKVA